MRDFLEENGFTPVSFFGGLLHHPDCPCRKVAAAR